MGKPLNEVGAAVAERLSGREKNRVVTGDEEAITPHLKEVAPELPEHMVALAKAVVSSIVMREAEEIRHQKRQSARNGDAPSPKGDPRHTGDDIPPDAGAAPPKKGGGSANPLMGNGAQPPSVEGEPSSGTGGALAGEEGDAPEKEPSSPAPGSIRFPS